MRWVYRKFPELTAASATSSWDEEERKAWMKWSFLLPLLSRDVSTICLDQHGVDFPGVLGLRRTCPLSGCPTPGRERFVWKDKDSLGRDLGALSSTSVRRRTILVETWNDVALAQTIINLEKETIRLFWDQQKNLLISWKGHFTKRRTFN